VSIDDPGTDETTEGVLEPIDSGSPGIDLPDDLEEAVVLLLDALGTAQKSANDYLDDLQRLAAEYENYRKRMERERDEITARSSQRLIEALLPVLDSFDHAFSREAQNERETQILTGVRGTYHLLMDTLSKEGLEHIAALGEPFDPTVHEAVAGGGDGDLVVAEELRSGYTLNGRVLRAAMVMVASPPDSAPPEGDEQT